jgi:hypothetical protein
MSPSVYLALCGLVKDAQEIDSDAAPLLRKAALELAAAASDLDATPEIEARVAALADTQTDRSNQSAA